MTSAIDRWVGRSLGGELPPQGVERRQLEKLRAQLGHARQNSLYQRGKLAGVDIGALTSLADLARLPVTTGRELIDHAAQMLCVPLSEVERISTVRSSGTSGAQKRLYFSKRDLARTVDFFAAGMAEVLQGAGRCAIFMSGPTENSIGRLLQQGLADIGVGAIIHGNLGDAEQARLVAQGAGCYVGLPGEMLYLCRTYPQLRPASLLLSADYVPASLVEAIEHTWGCPVFLHYGMTETCYGLAVQCAAREAMHLRSGEFLVEVADPLTGAPLPPGQEGEILLTTLESEALPLIRYRTGDIGRLAATACGCGSTLPALARVCGRLENLKEPINIHRLDELLFSYPAVRNYAARLEGDRLRLTVDLIDGGGAPDAGALSDTLDVAVRVERASLPPGRTPGKRRMGYA